MRGPRLTLAKDPIIVCSSKFEVDPYACLKLTEEINVKKLISRRRVNKRNGAALRVPLTCHDGLMQLVMTAKTALHAD